MKRNFNRRILLFLLPVAGFLFSSPLEASSEKIVFEETFKSDTLDAAWQISNHYPFATPRANPFSMVPVSGCEYSITNSRLVLSDRNPVAESVGGIMSAIAPEKSGYGHVFFTRDLPFEMDDFRLSFGLGWDNRVGDNATETGLNAMPLAFVTLLDSENNLIARVGLYDPWATGPAVRLLQIGDQIPDLRNAPRLGISSQGTHRITISRTAGNLKITWSAEGSEAVEQTGASSLPLAKVQIDFARFREDTLSATLGEIYVEAISLSVISPDLKD